MRIASSVLSLILILFTSIFAVAGPGQFTYQGTLTDAADAPLANQSVTLIFSVYNPAKTCLLYQETQSVMTDDNGVFVATIGSVVGNAKRTASDPALLMTKIFESAANTVVRSAGSNCSGGYTTGSGNDVRYLRINVAGTDLSPDLAITAVPFAITADNANGIDGFASTSLFRSSTAVAPDLTTTGVANLSFLAQPSVCASGQTATYNGANWTCASPTNPSGTDASKGVAGTAGRIYVATDTGSVYVDDGTSWVTMSGGGGSGITGLTGDVTATGSGSVTTTVQFVNAVPASTISTGALAGYNATSSSTPSTVVKRDSSGGFQAASFQATSISGRAILFADSGSGAVTVKAPSSVGGGYTMYWPSSAPTAGQTLTVDGSGNMSWASRFLGIADIRSSLAGNAQFFPTSCTSQQTLVWQSGTDTMICTAITLPATQVTGILPISSGGTGVTSLPGTFVLNGAQAGAVTAGTTDSNSLTLKTSSADRMTIDANGNVGVGTNSPSSLLNLFSTTTASVMKIQNTGTSKISFNNASGTLLGGIGSDSGASLVSYNGSGNPNFYVTAAGAAVLGSATLTSAKATNLQVSAASGSNKPGILADGNWYSGGSTTSTKPFFMIEPLGAMTATWSVDGTGFGVNAPMSFFGNLMDLQSNGNSLFVVTAQDGVGIGTSTPTAALDVAGHVAVSNGWAGTTTLSTNCTWALGGASDAKGIVDVTTTGTCTITFAQAYSQIPTCVVSYMGSYPVSQPLVITSMSTGAITVATSGGGNLSSGVKFSYICLQ